MTRGFQHFGPTEYDTLSAADRLVLHVDPDEATRAATAAVITAQDSDVDVVSVSTTERVAELCTDLPVDCLVVGDVASPEAIADVAVPVVLYAPGDPAELDPALLGVADTVVERRDDRPSEFLARKVLSLVAAEPDRTQHALSRALSRVTAPDHAGTHAFLVDDGGEIRWASAPFERVFPVEGRGTASRAEGGFDDRLQAMLADSPAALATVLRTKRGADHAPPESIPVGTDGEAYFVHSGYRLPSDLGSLRLELFEDVTESVRRDARGELLELLVEESRDGLYTLDPQGNIEFCNRSFAGMLGYEIDELLGRHASAIMAPGELQRGQERIGELLGTDRDSATVDLTLCKRSGETFDVSIHFTVLPAADAAYAGLMGVVRDITDRKQRERELGKYRELVETARDPMFVLDADGRVTLCNEAMRGAIDDDRLVGRQLGELFPQPDGSSVDAVVEELRTGDSEWERYELRLSEDDRFYEATLGTFYEESELAGVVGTLRDVTERIRRTHELNLLKQVLARVLRHNIRTQLTVIISYGEQLVDGSTDPVLAGERILRSADSLLATAEKARTIERLVDNDYDRQTLDLSAVVEEGVGTVARDHPEASYAVDVPSVAVRAHPALATAVENAVENAVVHTADPEVRLEASVTDDSVELRVVDNGLGISEPNLVALEQRAETPLQHTGGAGLWLIDWVIRRSGGTLAFDSGSDGTTVRMVLERAR